MRIAFILLFFVSFVYADRDGGPYVGVGYSYCEYGDDGFYKQMDEKSAASWMLYAGAVINKHLSVEFAYHDFGSYKTEGLNSEKIKAYSISTLGHYPVFNERLDLFVKFGVGELNMQSASQSGFSYVYGVGTSYRFTKKIASRIALERFAYKYEQSKEQQMYNMNVDTLYVTVEVQF